jgi:hypothetical protein
MPTLKRRRIQSEEAQETIGNKGENISSLRPVSGGQFQERLRSGWNEAGKLRGCIF